MQHRILATTAVATSLLFYGLAPCQAEDALAAGIPSDVSKDGIALFVQVGESAVGNAKTMALKGCRGLKAASRESRALCKIVATFSNKCAAEALDPKNGTPGYGWAVAQSAAAANSEALDKCRASAGPDRQEACVLSAKSLSCDGTAR